MKYLYALFVFVPVAVVLELVGAGRSWVFVSAAIALIPASALLGRATDELATHTGPQIGGLLNVTLGNAAELIITIAAIREGLLELVKASVSGSILGNILLVLGASLLAGGARNGRQRFDAHMAGISSTMMTLAVVALVIPGIFTLGPRQVNGNGTEFLSIGVAVVLLVLYGLYVFYAVFRHRGAAPESPRVAAHAEWTLGLALGMLVAATAIAVVMSELLVRAVEPVVATLGLSELFLGVMIVPLVGNAAEHWAAVQAAVDDKMDLSLSIAVGSSLQVALFVAPVLVFLSLALGHPLELNFNMYELTALAGAVAVATFIAIDGESNWVEGAQLLAVYLIVGLGFFFLS